MIIDFRADSDHARRHDVLRASTGENLNHWCIMRADDVEGCVWVVAFGESGEVICRDGNTMLEERHEAIRIVPKSPERLAEIDAADRWGGEMMAVKSNRN